MGPIFLGVNIDHVATLRQMRLTVYPEPVQAALISERSGADSITVHLREDRRHVQEYDVFSIKEIITKPLNLEMAVTDEMLTFACKVKPKYCCFVPEKRKELTTEGGLDVKSQKDKVSDACARLIDAGIRVSLFIDADPKQLEATAETGAKVIEIHTGHYADATTTAVQEQEFQKITNAVATGVELGLQINAGHGLNYQNVQRIAAIQEIKELNIGHGIVARAIFTGLENAVREMKQLMLQARK